MEFKEAPVNAAQSDLVQETLLPLMTNPEVVLGLVVAAMFLAICMIRANVMRRRRRRRYEDVVT